jgi:signal transduction histidine kinase
VGQADEVAGAGRRYGRPVRSRWSERRQAQADAVLAVALALLAAVEALTATTPTGGLGGETHIAGPAAVVAASKVVAALALVRRRSAPGATLVAVTLLLAVPMVVFGASEGFGALAPVLVAVYSIGAYRERRTAAAGLALFTAYWVLYELRDPLNPDVGSALGSWPVYLLGVIAWLGGVYLRTRRLYVAELGENAEQRVRAAATEERARIARELHDAVAHAMTVIVIQAEAADEILARDPDGARLALHRIQATGREGLAEMRRLLGVLRQDERPALGPQPGIPTLGALVESVRATGLAVRFTVIGEPRVVAAGVDMSAYRIVQEALTNTIKHASASSITVVLRYGDRLELEVVDDGVGPATANGDGHGLVGMRERVALFGGTLEAGPATDRGYRVCATLPIEAGA